MFFGGGAEAGVALMVHSKILGTVCLERKSPLVVQEKKVEGIKSN